jgi:hypothetical protein
VSLYLCLGRFHVSVLGVSVFVSGKVSCECIGCLCMSGRFDVRVCVLGVSLYVYVEGFT